MAGNDRTTPLVTSRDVAREANVSQSTVSLVLNGKAEGRVAPATRELIKATAARLGYRPNVSAQMLRTGVGKTLAFAVPDIQQPFFGEVLVAAEVAARERGYSVLLVDTTTDPLWSERLVGMIRSRMIAGCITYTPDAEAEAKFADVADRVVMVESETPGRSGVDLTIASAMKSVVGHLAELGHRRIGHFAALYPKLTFRSRRAAFLAEMERIGLASDTRWHAASTFEVEVATEAAKELIASGVTAIACDDDLLAGAAYRAARQLGLSIPGDLSVVGFNDVELARLLHPELTTVRIPADRLGREAVGRLLDRLEGKAVRPHPTLIDLSLIVRQSTARPGR
ncbi:LacI family transcriptional regulator [Pleomorphomonas diazotrophica]|uniref:LacI family transcriptional regulator n=1 Tax=Pleomorphomonas diazotrophica TaxID=1166257 RepID=A0A2N3LYN1_9HYPH|nr:LacI family transcriptional regulator [Pleomorphomonas diazotrophica]